MAQTIKVAANLTPTNFVNMASVPSPVRGFLAAFGDRIQKPGNERTTLIGSYTSKSGSGQAELIWEAPGNLRFDRADQPGKSLVYNNAVSPTKTTAVSQADADILESLLDDSTEAFLYGFQNGTAYRFLGGGFQSPSGAFDIYQTVAPVRAQSNSTPRPKHFYFDSATKLLRKVLYLGPNGLNITTEFNKWVATNGQSHPSEIIRKENDVAVFTFNAISATVSETVSDAAFAAN